MFKTFDLNTDGNGMIEITEQVRQTVVESGVQEGIVIISIPHTTAGLTVFSWPDPKGFEDAHDELSRLVPTRIDFKHQHDTPQDAAGHIKSVLVGVTLTLIVTGGQPLLGHSQGIFFFEFDGPRRRKFYVKVAAD